MRTAITSVFAGMCVLVSLAFNNAGKVNICKKLPLNDTNRWPATFGLGRTATIKDINAWDIDVRPDGKGLPVGQGNATTGKVIYVQKCLSCHGLKEQVGVKLPGPVLVSDTVLKS